MGGITNAIPNLASPAWLLLLLALPLLAWAHHRRSSLGALTYSRLPAGPGKSGRRTRGAWRLHLPFYTRLLAFACLVAALARPQLGYAWEESLTEGIDVQLVLDVSGSMGAEDFKPKDRLTVAKQVVKEFVAGRPGDRLGLTIFSGAAMTRAPLTTDRDMLGLIVDSVELNTLPDGTAIGVALASAAARLKDSQAKTKIAVLVTDGANNAGAIDPISAAALCKGLGVKVYTIGVGSAGRVQVPLPVQDPVTGQTVTRRYIMNVPVDENLLRQISQRTGAQFYRATDREGLRRIFHEIDRLEKTPLHVKRYVRYREAFPPLVWAGLALLLLPLAAAGLQVTAEP
ncbi:MAG TPA: VWA domain-containing protein [Thermoanaerobaculia bacterium]|jgi:Ca-activated chloride channel family protein|nr:VWA domain-containing protein [Thermoanaerobaculia bacterium]